MEKYTNDRLRFTKNSSKIAAVVSIYINQLILSIEETNTIAHQKSADSGNEGWEHPAGDMQDSDETPSQSPVPVNSSLKLVAIVRYFGNNGNKIMTISLSKK